MKKKQELIIFEAGRSMSDEDWNLYAEENNLDVKDSESRNFYDNEESIYWYEAELANLDRKLSEDIIVIASLGLWNGRVSGYKELDDNLSSILTMIDYYDSGKIFLDSYDVKAVVPHHDGTNYLTFRVWKDGVTESQREKLTDAIYEGKDASNYITRYTKSLKKEIKDIYGW